MSEKIAMPTLTAMLSVRTGDSREQTERFLREFFDVITTGLESGDSIRIPGLGIFKTINVDSRKSVNVNTGEETIIPEHRKVVFLPGKELAAMVNAPFEMFQTMELTDELASAFETEQPEESEQPEQPEQPEEPEQSEEPEEPEQPEEAEESDRPEQLEPAELASDKKSDDSGEMEDSEQEPVVIVKRRFWPGFLTGFGVACLCGLIAWGVMIYMSLTRPSENMTVTAVAPAPVPAQNIQDETPSVPTQPSDRPVYDTISKTRYLTTMAKDHYGNFHLWPYIYMENEKTLGHPDRIRPGTQVVVPDLSKYGVDPGNQADIEKAKKLGLEIYARYK